MIHRRTLSAGVGRHAIRQTINSRTLHKGGLIFPFIAAITPGRQRILKPALTLEDRHRRAGLYEAMLRAIRLFNGDFQIRAGGDLA